MCCVGLKLGWPLFLASTVHSSKNHFHLCNSTMKCLWACNISPEQSQHNKKSGRHSNLQKIGKSEAEEARLIKYRLVYFLSLHVYCFCQCFCLFITVCTYFLSFSSYLFYLPVSSSLSLFYLPICYHHFLIHFLGYFLVFEIRFIVFLRFAPFSHCVSLFPE